MVLSSFDFIITTSTGDSENHPAEAEREPTTEPETERQKLRHKENQGENQHERNKS